MIPTQNIKSADLSGLPVGERAVLELVALRLLCAVGQPYEYGETVAILDCAGYRFTAKGRTVQNPGWRAIEKSYRAGLKDKPEQESDNEDKSLPVIAEGQTFEGVVPDIKEGKTSQPKHFTDVIFCERKEWIGIEERSSA